MEWALNEAARRCEAVLFLISKAWLASQWCMNELTLARRLNKRLFGVLIEEGLPIADLPPDVTSTWQVVNLAAGRDHQQFRVMLPITGEEVHVTYSHEGLARLKGGLHATLGIAPAEAFGASMHNLIEHGSQLEAHPCNGHHSSWWAKGTDKGASQIKSLYLSVACVQRLRGSLGGDIVLLMAARREAPAS